MTTEPKASLGGDEPLAANAPEPFMYAYECIEDGRWQAYRQQLKRADGSICPGKPLYAAPVLPVEVRSGDVWSNIKARLAAQINLAEDHLNSTVSIRIRDAKTILSTITGDA